MSLPPFLKSQQSAPWFCWHREAGCVLVVDFLQIWILIVVWNPVNGVDVTAKIVWPILTIQLGTGSVEDDWSDTVGEWYTIATPPLQVKGTVAPFESCARMEHSLRNTIPTIQLSPLNQYIPLNGTSSGAICTAPLLHCGIDSAWMNGCYWESTCYPGEGQRGRQSSTVTDCACAENTDSTLRGLGVSGVCFHGWHWTTGILRNISVNSITLKNPVDKQVKEQNWR